MSFCAALSAQTRERHARDRGLEDAMRFGERVVEPGAFFEFGLVQFALAHQIFRGLAALISQVLNAVSQQRRPANRQIYFLLCSLHFNAQPIRAARLFA